jgi:GntR family transcriptional regulator
VNSLKISLDFGSSDPIYAQIVNQVREQLTTGELKPGDQLPTVRQLASDLRVNFNTVARAYRLLDEAGQISTQRGRGTYLLERDENATKEMVKKETIEEQLERTIQSLLRQGYNREEIQNSLKEILK